MYHASVMQVLVILGRQDWLEKFMKRHGFFLMLTDYQPAFAKRSCAQGDNVYHGNQATAALKGLPLN